MVVAMARAILINGQWQASFRMQPRGKWHTVKNTRSEIIAYANEDDAMSAAMNVGRMYRTGATQ